MYCSSYVYYCLFRSKEDWGNNNKIERETQLKNVTKVYGYQVKNSKDIRLDIFCKDYRINLKFREEFQAF